MRGVQHGVQDIAMKRPLQGAPRRWGRALAVGLAAALGAGLAGCGGSKGAGAGTDPATAVPASAPLYVGATVRPSGSLESAALAAGRKLTRQRDPYLRLVALLQTPGSPPLSFRREVAPWLGPQAGLFLSASSSPGRAQGDALLSLLQQGVLGSSPAGSAYPFGAGGAVGAIVMDTTDVAKARLFLASQARRAGAHVASYRGVTYQSSPSGVAFAVVHRFAVIGSESSLRGVIDTTAGGSALARAPGYAKLLAAARPGPVAHAYVNAARMSSAGGESAPLAQLLAGMRESNISLVPSSAAIAIDADLLAPAGASGVAGGGGLLASGADGAQALNELPGDSWLALGLGHVGATLAEDVRGLRALASLAAPGSGASAPVGLNLKGLLEGLLTPLAELGTNSAQARRDFTSWMSSGGVFASGTSLLELKAAVVIASTSPSRSRSAVATLAAQLRKAGASVQAASIPGTDAAVAVRLSGLPLELDIANGRDPSGRTKFVLGLGEGSVTAALSPSSTLAGAAATNAAGLALGEGIQPNLILDVPTLLTLLEGVGLTEDSSFSRIAGYLRSVNMLVGGVRDLGGGVKRVRVVAGLR
jgi:hypothetical protein